MWVSWATDCSCKRCFPVLLLSDFELSLLYTWATPNLRSYPSQLQHRFRLLPSRRASSLCAGSSWSFKSITNWPTRGLQRPQTAKPPNSRVSKLSHTRSQSKLWVWCCLCQSACPLVSCSVDAISTMLPLLVRRSFTRKRSLLKTFSRLSTTINSSQIASLTLWKLLLKRCSNPKFNPKCPFQLILN